ncbi:histidinol-phosphatase [Fodinicurvata sediminis]|uniref:histidinol-phosphatase n=1 Tax=Fodinicurvata sediminis TaxID=1121832 RepID=UPI0003B2FCBB|nr:histidinol-phosphatase [Fodinicurvata sediminis]
MPPNTPQDAEECLAETTDFAAELAQRAGRLALQYFRQRLDIEVKGDDSPVTIADRAVERLLRTGIRERFPEHAILGEEFGQTGSNEAFTWVLDPIDGTRSFITGWPIWGTLVSLLHNGRPELGIIEMPALSERWIAERTRGTRFENASGATSRAVTSGTRTLAEARFYTTSLLFFEGEARQRIEGIARAAHTARFGGDCYIYGLLASGHVDLVIENRLMPYDFLATVPVVEEAGGIITDWSGRTLDAESDGRVVAAATPELHAIALKMLSA